MIPRHIGIIMDGNRRFAKRVMESPWMGHKWGLEKAREVLDWSCTLGIKHITAYTLSLENLAQRPKRELKLILDYVREECDNMLKNEEHPVNRHRVKVRFIGRRRILPDDIQRAMEKVEEKTSGYENHVLNIAVAYGGQQEIVDAVREIVKKGLKGVIRPSDINEDIIRHHLYTNGQPSPDLIIRTGGERRLSNFLPFQSAYSELMFTDKKWPDMKKKDFLKLLKDFEKRERRFGK